MCVALKWLYAVSYIFRAHFADSFRKKYYSYRRLLDSATHPCLAAEAFASDLRLVLAQSRAPYKGYGENEALIEILSTLDVKGATITIDAIGCQEKIVEHLQEKKADYVLALKGNQGSMFEAVESHFAHDGLRGQSSYHETLDKGHGRLEIRRYWVTDDIRCLAGLGSWSGLKSIVMVEAERTQREKTTLEKRYFISSLPKDAPRHAHAIRSHWAIENSLHWVLDVTFSEDRCRTRTKNAPENMAIMRRMCINVLHKIRGSKDSLKGMRMRASCNDNNLFRYLHEF